MLMVVQCNSTHSSHDITDTGEIIHLAIVHIHCKHAI
jgi:hypothetical protein